MHYTQRLQEVLDALKINGESFDETENDPEEEFRLLHDMLEKALPSQTEQQVERLAHYVADDPEEALEALFQADEDGNAFDAADDHVMIWEPLEGRFTVSELLEQIGA